VVLIQRRKRRWAEHLAHTGQKRNPIRYLAGKLEVKRLLVSPGHRRKHNIK
jgi:hypothetical protein